MNGTATTTGERRERLSTLVSPPTEPQQLAVVTPPAPQAVPPVAPAATVDASADTVPVVMGQVYSHSPQIDQFVTALARAQGKFPAIEATWEAEVKSKREGAGSYTYQYADLADVLNAVRPTLSEEGIAIMQFPSTGQHSLLVTTLLVHSSGQWFKSDLRVGLYSLDPQSIGSAITYARRYGLQPMLGVAPAHVDDDDGARASRQYADSYFNGPRNGNGSPVRTGAGPVAMPQRAPMNPPPSSAAPGSAQAGTAAPASVSGPQTSAAFTITHCEPKTSSKQKPYWLVRFSNGVVAATFDKSMGEACLAAQKAGTRYIDADITVRGDWRFLEQLMPAGGGQ